MIASLAKDQAYHIVFDGGSKGNPGHGYGSFAIFHQDELIKHQALDFAHLGDAVTNNEAEYLSLIGALDHLTKHLKGETTSASLEIRGDSQLILSQVGGKWKVKRESLKPLHKRAIELIGKFRSANLVWHPRAVSVRILGH